MWQFLLNLFSKTPKPTKVETKSQPVLAPVNDSRTQKKVHMITLKDYLTASGKYPERENHKEVTDEVKANATTLLSKVTAFLSEIGIESVKVSSGFRPSDVNGSIPGAAKKSSHMTGKAIDIKDVDGSIAKLAASRSDLLRKYGLMIENPTATNGWMHLDIATRADRPSRMFNP